MKIKSGKIIKSLEVFFQSFSFWSNLILARTCVARHEKRFVSAFLRVSVNHLVWKKKLLFW